MPPEPEPVMPARTEAAKARLIGTLPPMPSARSRIAAKAVAPKNAIGIAFEIAGGPGTGDTGMVKEPSATAAGMSRSGRSGWRNRAAATGSTAKATTNSNTPP